MADGGWRMVVDGCCKRMAAARRVEAWLPSDSCTVKVVVALCHGRSSLPTGQWMEGWDGMGWDGKWMMD